MINSELSALVALPFEVDKSYSEERIIMLFSSIFTFYFFLFWKLLSNSMDFKAFPNIS